MLYARADTLALDAKAAEACWQVATAFAANCRGKWTRLCSMYRPSN